MSASSSSGRWAVRDIGDVLLNGRKTFFGHTAGRAMVHRGVRIRRGGDM